jgi:hypothetical protein
MIRQGPYSRIEPHGPEVLIFVYGSFEDSFISQLPPGQKISSQRL